MAKECSFCGKRIGYMSNDPLIVQDYVICDTCMKPVSGALHILTNCKEKDIFIEKSNEIVDYSNEHFTPEITEEFKTRISKIYDLRKEELIPTRSERATMAKEDAEKQRALASMLITSGFTFDGYTITKYSGYISGDDAIQVNRGTAVLGMATANAGSDLTDALVKIRRQALKELKEAAYVLGCNAVIGVDFDYITLEPETASISGKTTYLPYVFCVTANGNAVVIEKDEPAISVVDVLREYKQLLDEGIITWEEFEAKKREFL